MDALASRFQSASWWTWFHETETTNDESPNVRLVQGSLCLDTSLELRDDPWACIVDGDLELRGDLLCETPESRTSTLIITGSLRARNVVFGSSARISVKGDTTLSGFVHGIWGDGGAEFGTTGTLDARGVLLDSHTPISAGRFATLILGGTGWRAFKPDFLDGNADVFVPEVLDRGGPFVDFHRAEQWIREGRSVFLPEREAEWRARKGLRPWS